MSSIDNRTIYKNYFYNIDNKELNDDIIKESLIAESIRYALNNNRNEATHVLSIKNWVMRKLRSIYPDIELEQNTIITSILKDGPGPNLDFLGDVIKLSQGYYLPSPTRIIKIEENKFILISGLPTKFFIDAGLDVEIIGISRMIQNITLTELTKYNIPIQSIESYLGLYDIYNTTYLEYVLNHREYSKWIPEKGMESYDLEKSKTYGYDYWGVNISECTHPRGFLSLWRFKRELERYEYKLLIKKPLILDKSNKIVNITNTEYLSIVLPGASYKKICLALDMLSNHKRVVYFKKLNNHILINLNFSPPEELMKFINAIGGRWQPYEKPYLRWVILYHGIKTLEDIFRYLNVDVEWQ